jgi:hypothetical protein
MAIARHCQKRALFSLCGIAIDSQAARPVRYGVQCEAKHSVPGSGFDWLGVVPYPAAADQRWMALPRKSARGQTRATRGANDPPQGQLRVPCSCLLLKYPWLPIARRCFKLPRSSILCGCINIFPSEKLIAIYNAVWGRYSTACTMYGNSLKFIGCSHGTWWTKAEVIGNTSM